MKSSILWNITKIGLCLLLASCGIHGWFIRHREDEATCSSETSVDFQRTTRHYIPQDIILQIIKMFPILMEPEILLPSSPSPHVSPIQVRLVP
jgi:hypothetical protein